MFKRLSAATAAAAVVVAVVPAYVSAHGEKGELYVPWADSITEQRAVNYFSSSSDASASALAAPSGPGISNLSLVGNADKDGPVNSDLAFWGNLAYAGNYGGFRILDISADQPRTVVDQACNGPQNDVSVYEMGGKRFLFQSIDTPQTAEDCSSANAPLIGGTNRVGFEGVRVFDVTNPASPVFLDMIQTACGSHTHTLIPDGNQAYIYVASYPLGSNITPPGVDLTPFGPEYRACEVPHKKISIIKVGTRHGQFQYERKEQPLSDDTTPDLGFQACHDFQIFEKRHIALASCAGDAQLWDISDPWNPTSDVPGKHTHIHSPSAADQFEFIHSGVFTWDGKYFAIMDETGGGGTANCFGPGESKDGFYYFYPLVKPGEAEPQLLSRYLIPRPQGTEVCVSHNASVIPVKKRNVMTASYYQGGVTMVDFTDVRNPQEIAFADLEDATGNSDEWSSYWYNGRIYSNGGLARRGATGNRGVDVFAPDKSLKLNHAETWWRSNPQTQEAWQAP